MLQIISGTQEMFLEQADYGSEKLPYTRSLSKRCPVPPSPFCSPDFFDAEQNWHRAITVEQNLLTLSVAQEGTVSWHSQHPIPIASVHKKLSQLLIPLPLPEAAYTLLPADVASFFLSRAPLVHIASETLWEALVKGVIRQVITALQAKKVLHRFITCFGERVERGDVVYYAFPTIDAIMHASFDDLLACGLGFKAKTILRLAQALYEQPGIEDFVRAASPDEALRMLQTIKGIGDWTARVAYCDLKAMWDVHPYDLAVRHWTGKTFSEIAWQKSEMDFKAEFLTRMGAYAGAVMPYLLAYGPLFSSSKNFLQSLL